MTEGTNKQSFSKKAVRQVETAGLVVLIALFAYRLFAGVDSQVLLRTILTMLSIFYMWFGFFLFNYLKPSELLKPRNWKGISAFRITSSIIFGFLYSFSFIAVLFAVNFYSAMNTMVVLAFLLNLGAVLFSLLILQTKKESFTYMRQYIIRSGILCIFFFAVWLTPVNQRLHILFKDQPGFTEAYESYLNNPDDPENLQRLKEERSKFR